MVLISLSGTLLGIKTQLQLPDGMLPAAELIASMFYKCPGWGRWVCPCVRVWVGEMFPAFRGLLVVLKRAPRASGIHEVFLCSEIRSRSLR